MKQETAAVECNSEVGHTHYTAVQSSSETQGGFTLGWVLPDSFSIFFQCGSNWAVLLFVTNWWYDMIICFDDYQGQILHWNAGAVWSCHWVLYQFGKMHFFFPNSCSMLNKHEALLNENIHSCIVGIGI